jgi:hypothetical protein
MTNLKAILITIAVFAICLTVWQLTNIHYI